MRQNRVQVTITFVANRVDKCSFSRQGYEASRHFDLSITGSDAVSNDAGDASSFAKTRIRYCVFARKLDPQVWYLAAIHCCRKLLTMLDHHYSVNIVWSFKQIVETSL